MTNFKDLDFLVESLRKVDTGKNHILITGNIKVGKSTLLNAFIKKYYKNSKIDGIMTELVITDKFRIELFRHGTEERFVIGERESEMKFFDEVFLKNSYEFMDDFKNNDISIRSIKKLLKKFNILKDSLIEKEKEQYILMLSLIMHFFIKELDLKAPRDNRKIMIVIF